MTSWLAVPITTMAATDRPSKAMRKRRLRALYTSSAIVEKRRQ